MLRLFSDMHSASLSTLSASGLTNPFDRGGVQSTRPGGKAPGALRSNEPGPPTTDDVSISTEARAAQQSGDTESSSTSLTQQELSQLQKLKRRDSEVRTHEQAHLSAAGQYARGSASFTFQKGPDGNSYAVGGEVPIDLSTEQTPAATISKMQAVKRAALAPASPSATDRQIASQAAAKESQARQELARETLTPDRSSSDTPPKRGEDSTVSGSESNNVSSQSGSGKNPTVARLLSIYSTNSHL